MPFPYKRILCPVDFDECSAEALREAGALALSNAGTVDVLHVVEINALVNQGALEGLSAGELYQSQLKFARQQVEQMLTAIAPAMKRAVTVEVGEPGDSILDTAAKLGTDLIVMATHGRRGLKHLVLGSVAERIVRESRVPVLTVRPARRSRSE
ncbi:MAG TPA: universal stress protein [Candidatus Binataceae bacterium]|nr:universal stress protein [Candidatus Binataceae bacterium]